MAKKHAAGILLTTQNICGDYALHVDDVLEVDGVPQWKPEINITSINWKKIINAL